MDNYIAWQKDIVTEADQLRQQSRQEQHARLSRLAACGRFGMMKAMAIMEQLGLPDGWLATGPQSDTADVYLRGDRR